MVIFVTYLPIMAHYKEKKLTNLSVKPTYHSRLYRDFRSIGYKEYYEIIRFYERHETDICRLTFDEYFEMLVSYTNALFEVEYFQKYALMSQTLIETIFHENLSNRWIDTVFHKTLIRKAAAHLALKEFDAAEHVLLQSLRLNDDKRLQIILLRKVMQQRTAKFVHTLRAIAIFVLLTTAILIAVKVLLVRNWYIDLAPFIEMLRNVYFFMSFLVLSSVYLTHRLRIYYKVKKIALNRN